MGFSHWLRQSSEHYLLVDAQRQMGDKYDRPVTLPRGWRDRFWLGLFAPVYRRLPWKLRKATIQMMPGSHRQTWTTPATRGTPAVGPVFPCSPVFSGGSAMPQPAPENRGE